MERWLLYNRSDIGSGHSMGQRSIYLGTIKLVVLYLACCKRSHHQLTGKDTIQAESREKPVRAEYGDKEVLFHSFHLSEKRYF